MATSPVKDFLVTYLMPEKCYGEIFVHFHWHVPCVKFVLNRICGFWILLDTLLAQLPQLLKILWRGGAEGLSLTSILLHLYALLCPVVYAIANNFPLSAWAERLFVSGQIAVIIFLILHYRGHTLKGLLLPLGFAGGVFLLGSCAPAAFISVMQTSILPALIASKVLQTVTNHRNGHTGQLSTLSVFLSWTGSLSVAFVSLQETESSVSSLSHILSACLSCVLLAQVLCYRSSTTTDAKKTE